MKIMMIGNLLKLGRRHLHTIISREIVKPSSPTPPHLQIYNLSFIGQAIANVYIPLVFFYPNYNNHNASIDKKTIELKKSLSQSLKQYYPLAGRFPTSSTSYVVCNDEGVMFLEARNDRKIDEFLDKEEQDETLNQLFPDGLVWGKSHDKDGTNTVPLVVQLNHFSCGGVAVAVSMSHKIGDGCTLATFMNHWATVARCGSIDHKQVLLTNPHWISFEVNKTIAQEFRFDEGIDCVTRKFVFSNSKLSDLKNKILSMATGDAPVINNPTRVEVLTSLLYKCAVKAATTNLDCFDSFSLSTVMNMRKKMIEKLPETTVGNIFTILMIQTRNPSELMLNAVVAEYQKSKMRLGGIRNVQEADEIFSTMLSNLESGMPQRVSFDNNYFSSSFCGFPLYKVDFGLGKPAQATFRFGDEHPNFFILMDTPDGEGIEALVVLRKKDMLIFQNDEELLAFS